MIPPVKGRPLRVYAEGGCCSSVDYGMGFDEKKSNDYTLSFPEFSVVVDPGKRGSDPRCYHRLRRRRPGRHI